jgi:hypothetical protein
MSQIIKEKVQTTLIKYRQSLPAKLCHLVKFIPNIVYLFSPQTNSNLIYFFAGSSGHHSVHKKYIVDSHLTFLNLYQRINLLLNLVETTIKKYM